MQQPIDIYQTVDIAASRTTQPTPTKELSVFPTEESIDSPVKDDIHKQKFFRKCMGVKQKLPQNSYAQVVPITYLYNKAVSDKIPEEIWDAFIKEELSFPKEMPITRASSYRTAPIYKTKTQFIMSSDV